MEVRRRAPRTTRLQYEIIIDFLEKNEDLFTCEKNVDQFVKIQNKWSELALQLNSSNVGPQKSIKDWKNVISEWKTNTKKKSRELKKSLDNGIDSKIYLRNTEERLMNLIHKHNSDSLLEDSKIDMQHNNNLNFNLSDFCEVSLAEENPTNINSSSQKNNNFDNEIEPPIQHKTTLQENISRPKRLTVKMHNKISARRQKFRRRLILQKTIKAHTQTIETLTRANNQLTESIKKLGNSFHSVSNSVDMLVKILHKLSES